MCSAAPQAEDMSRVEGTAGSTPAGEPSGAGPARGGGGGVRRPPGPSFGLESGPRGRRAINTAARGKGCHLSCNGSTICIYLFICLFIYYLLLFNYYYYLCFIYYFIRGENT